MSKRNIKPALTRLLDMLPFSARSDPFRVFKRGYSNLSRDQIQADMDRRYQTGDAYPNASLWIHAHHRNLEQAFVDLVGTASIGAQILEIGCGSGGVAAHWLAGAGRIVATDLSEAALNIARAFFRERHEIEFLHSPAEKIDLPSAVFDIAISKEVIEHLHDPVMLIEEAFRLLRPDGIFVISSPNKDSLHLRVNRLFDRDDFMSSGDHIREFSYGEMSDMLVRTGFEIETARGVTLLPYHCVGGVFPPEIQFAEDNNEEFVKLLSDLGSLVGPEYAFCYVIKCKKR